MKFEGLKNPELQAKLKNAKTPEDLLALAKEEGYELSDEQLEAVSGGVNWSCWDAAGCMDVCDDFHAWDEGW